MKYVINMKRNAAIFVTGMILLAGCVLAGCGGKQQPTLSPEAQMAVQARAVVKAADTVVTGIDNAISSHQLTVPVGRQLLLAIRQVGVQGQTLADALAVVDNAKTAAEKQQGLDKARAALATIQATMGGAISPITDTATKAQVNTLLKDLTDAVQTVQQLLATARTANDPSDQPKRLQFDRHGVPAWTAAA